ncbi:MAG: hypothetical protein IPN29_04545 [Saprospiraceae bacterium]|nr:hypothetical protein [Saprospiraceae bacterium]
MNHKIFRILVVFMMSVILFSCQKKERTDFTVEEKVLYDSLRVIAFRDIRNNTEGICASVKDSLFTVYADSIFELRMAEVNQLFEE